MACRVGHFVLSADLDPDDENGQWLKTACYRCLIHMGDAGECVPHPSTYTWYTPFYLISPW